MSDYVAPMQVRIVDQGVWNPLDVRISDGDGAMAKFESNGRLAVSLPEEPVLEYTNVCEKSRWALIKAINEKARLRWRFVSYSPELGAVMCRPVDSAKVEADLQHQRSVLEARSSALNHAIKELQSRGEAVLAREKAVSDKEDRIEKIRSGMVEDGSLKLDPRARSLLEELAPKAVASRPRVVDEDVPPEPKKPEIEFHASL